MTDPSPTPVPIAGHAIRPDPGPEEAAAIVAAVQVVLSGGAAGPDEAAEMPRWRFSGRWWSKPVPQRRDRP